MRRANSVVKVNGTKRSKAAGVAASRLVSNMHAVKPGLDALYETWNRPEFISPDPLQTMRRFSNPDDREIAGLIASCLAFGNVKQILASIANVLEAMPRPAKWLDEATPRRIESTFTSFRHRYSTGAELTAMLVGAKNIRERHGNLGNAFARCIADTDEDILPGLQRFIGLLNVNGSANYLLPDPQRGSACKRLHLYLRWMVRSDAVDPGGWTQISPAKLIVPVDTHMHRIAMGLGLTRRNAADLRTAREITAAFRIIAPEDPVRYDFALTRLGIRKDTTPAPFMAECSGLLLR